MPCICLIFNISEVISKLPVWQYLKHQYQLVMFYHSIIGDNFFVLFELSSFVTSEVTELFSKLRQKY